MRTNGGILPDKYPKQNQYKKYQHIINYRYKHNQINKTEKTKNTKAKKRKRNGNLDTFSSTVMIPKLFLEEISHKEKGFRSGKDDIK